MMKKVLLVNTNVERAPYPVPPLGLCLIASAIQDRYEVMVYDGVFDGGRGLVALVNQFKPDVVGFSIRNIDDVVMDREIFYVDAICSSFIEPVKAVTDVPIILGGSGFSIFPEELMAMTGADFGIAGEAEELLPLLLDKIQNQEQTVDIPNLYTKNNRKVQQGPVYFQNLQGSKKHSEIDRWIDFAPYRAKGVYSIQTKRGCAHGCIYCTYPVIEGRKFRRRLPADIADEIEMAHRRLGYVTFEFVDSTFNDPKGHAESICREIIRRGIKVRLRTMGINPRHANEELFGLMLQAGFVQIDATPDTASPRMLESLDKGFTLDEIARMAELITRYDMPTMWFFLFGGPGEDETTFRETLSFIDSFVNRADLVYMNAGLRIYPGTPLYKTAVNEGFILPDQSVFQPPVYYYSQLIGKTALDKLIREASSSRNNCLHALETAPSPEMIAEALQMRSLGHHPDEPMFRTLLRVRESWKAGGKL